MGFQYKMSQKELGADPGIHGSQRGHGIRRQQQEGNIRLSANDASRAGVSQPRQPAKGLLKAYAEKMTGLSLNAA